VVEAANPLQEVPLKGLNFFGFNNEQAMIDGLWAGGTAAATDFNLIVHSVRLLGFNAVRLTFNMRVFDQYPTSKSQWCATAAAGGPPITPLPACHAGRWRSRQAPLAAAGPISPRPACPALSQTRCRGAAAGASPPAPTPSPGG
jgi:hypothetical protein